MLLVFVAVSYLMSGQPVTGAKILLVPFAQYSHIISLTSIADVLHSRGHQLYIVLPENFALLDRVMSEHNLTVLTFSVSEVGILDDVSKIPKFRGDMTNTILRTVAEGVLPMCTNALSDDKLFRKLQDLRFDLALMDSFPLSRCNLIIPYRLGIPYVSFNTHYEPWLQSLPHLPSFVPFLYGSDFSEQMTFWQRLCNLYNLIEWSYDERIPMLSKAFVAKYAPEMPACSIDDLAKNSSLWLIETDSVIDYPRPLMPHVLEVGGLVATAASPLVSELEAFVSVARNGVILVSFGSWLEETLPQDFADKLMSVFMQLKESVIWKTSSVLPANIPARIKVMKWIPQKDILGHLKTRLFITHGGNNGQFEALFHGVPMITMPIQADQPYDATRVEYKGFGLRVNPFDFTTDELLGKINTILTNKTYEENIKKASEIYRFRREHPAERAANGIEHVLRFGSGHLKSHSIYMPWYQYYMLDLLIFLFVVFWLMFYIIVNLVRCVVCFLCCPQAGNRKVKVN